MKNLDLIKLLLETATNFIDNLKAESDDLWVVPILNKIDAAAILANLDQELSDIATLAADCTSDEVEEAILDAGLFIDRFGQRTDSEIENYLTEAFDKVWYCRTHESLDPSIEKARLEAKTRIESTYTDLPASDWDLGYWSGILSALRWVLGSDKDNLDT